MVEKKKFTINSKDLGVAREYKIDFEGISHFIKQHDERFNKHKTTLAKGIYGRNKCPVCEVLA
jgi:excinuclease ABC subunit A